MIEIKNNLFQPIAFHLPGVEKSLHMNPRERRLLREKDISDEIKALERRRIVTLKKAESALPASAPRPDQKEKPELNKCTEAPGSPEIQETSEDKTEEPADTKTSRRGKRR